MPELTVVAEASGGHIRSDNRDDNYAHALSGDSLFATVTAFTNATATVGQSYSSASTLYRVYQTFLAFRVDDLPFDATDAVLSIWPTADNSATDFVLEAWAIDWGDTFESSDWVPVDDLANLPLLASLDTSGIITGQYEAMTSESALVSAINAARVGDGVLRVVLMSSRTRTADAPSGTETLTYSSGHDTSEPTQKPVLVIQYEETAPAGDGAGGIGAPLLYRARVAARRR